MKKLILGLVIGVALMGSIGAMVDQMDNLHRIGRAGEPGDFNAFELYTFKEQGHRCFVVVKLDGNIDLDCP